MATTKLDYTYALTYGDNLLATTRITVTSTTAAEAWQTLTTSDVFTRNVSNVKLVRVKAPTPASIDHKRNNSRRFVIGTYDKDGRLHTTRTDWHKLNESQRWFVLGMRVEQTRWLDDNTRIERIA